jgi:hypothetical protein
MVGDAELLFDHPGKHRRGPHPAVQSIGHGTAVEMSPSLLCCTPVNRGGRPDR